MQGWVNRNGLIDIGFQGAPYTWANNFVKERLDRGFCCTDWRLIFPEATITHLARINSDHCPIMVKLFPNASGPRKNTPFRFQAMWLEHKNFSDLFQSTWNCSSGNLLQKTNYLADKLLQWNKNVFGNIFKQKRTLLARLCGIQKAMAFNPNPFLSKLEKDLTTEYNFIKDAEALFWKQKSRDRWLQDGDRNTKFFHLTTVIRRRKNKIDGLLDDAGVLQSDPGKMQQIAAGFFKNLFTSVNEPPCDLITSTRFPSSPFSVLRNLYRPVSPQEIHANLFQIGKFKAPGHDGFPAAFFQDQWDSCGPDVIKYVTEIFEQSSIPLELNHTLIALVPKSVSPQDMSLFRPISLCCTIYKVISKIIVSRLRPLLCQWISPNQVSYVPGRHISDNVMIVQDLIHKFRHTSGKKGFLAWKIDLSKAYDKLSWHFVQMVLSELQMPAAMAKLIMSCISTSSFQVLVNGELSESFHGNRGIRQGDPLSPYLFVLCMEKFSHLIKDKVKDGYWKPVKATRFGPSISHLFFADDLILFAEATPHQAKVLKNAIDLFCKASGQSVNFSKSAIYCSPNTRATISSEISNICGSPLTNDLGKYLGMPILHSRVGKHTYASLIDKAQARLASWKSKTLNISGRLTLIQSVTSAIPIYAMQTTKLPIHTCDRLDSINRNFLWGDTTDQKKVHLVNWSEVCKPKALGGIGLKKTREMNQAMLAKAGWRIFKDDSGLWSQIFRKKYLCNIAFPQNYKKPASCSNVWSSISFGAKLLGKGLKWRIGDGTTVKFWQDVWTDFGPLSNYACLPRQITLDALVCEFWSHGGWNIPLLTDHLPPNIVSHIIAIPISHAADPDKLIWGASSSGVFTVKSAYMLNFPDRGSLSTSWLKIWKMHVPPKMKFFIWTMVKGKLLTNVQRVKRHFTSDPSCFHCPNTPETLLHLFRDCPKARMVWNTISSPSISPHFLSMSWTEWITANLFQNRCFFLNIPWSSIFTFFCWHIWKWRCKFIFDSNFILPADMRSIIFSYVDEWINARRKTHKNGPSFPVRMQWEKPPPGFMKINVDGSCSGNGVISAGGVLRNHIGCWQGGFYANLGSGDILQAEIWGILYGLQLALRYDVKNVEVESDSNSVIDLILSSDASNHPLGTVIMNCRSLRASFTECSFKHVHREKNIVADHLAKVSLSKPQGVTWLVDAPYAVTKLIFEDIAGIARLRMLPHPMHSICDFPVTAVPEENAPVILTDVPSMRDVHCPDYGNPTWLSGSDRIIQQEEALTAFIADRDPEERQERLPNAATRLIDSSLAQHMHSIDLNRQERYANEANGVLLEQNVHMEDCIPNTMHGSYG